MDEEVIATMFAEHNLTLEQLDPHLPPAYCPDSGEQGKGGSILNLVYRALALKKIRDKAAKSKEKDSRARAEKEAEEKKAAESLQQEGTGEGTG